MTTVSFDKVAALTIVAAAGTEVGGALGSMRAKDCIATLKSARESLPADKLEKDVGELRDAFYVAGLVAAGALDIVAAREAIKPSNAGKRDENVTRALGALKFRWSYYRDAAGYPKLRKGGAPRKANAVEPEDAGEAADHGESLTVDQAQLTARDVPTFVKADEPLDYVKTIAAHLTATEKRNATMLQSCGAPLRDLAEAARRIAAGELIFIMTADQLTHHDDEAEIRIAAKVRAAIEAEIKAVNKAKRDARKLDAHKTDEQLEQRDAAEITQIRAEVRSRKLRRTLRAVNKAKRDARKLAA